VPRITCAIAVVALTGSSLGGCKPDSRKKANTELGKVEVTTDLPPLPGSPTPTAPESAFEPFRVWVNQESPRQKKTPEWRTIPGKEGVVLDMAPDGNWTCLVNPVQVFGNGDDGRVAHWTTSRTVRCSSDNWRTSVQGLVRVGYDPDGKRGESDPPVALYLKDIVAGVPRVTVVVLESVKPH